MTSFSTLSDFLDHCERRGDLLRIAREVDPEYEVTEIAGREARAEGPALLFEKVRGAKFPLAVNVLAARRRVEWALGRTPVQVGEELSALMRAVPPERLSALWGLRGSLGRALAMRPRRVAAARRELPAQLSGLPNLKLWPKDGGRFVTFGLVLTSDPDTGKRNLGIYRMHIHDETTTGMHWQINKGGGYHFHVAEKRGRPLPVAVSVGADPCLLLSAVAPLPEGIDELAFAGFLRGRPTRLARARRVDAWVPADAEFVLEGEVAPAERMPEGPFGDHFGHYSHVAPFPVFRLQAITARERPIYQASIVGKPPQEDKVMGEAVQEFFSGVLRVLFPEVRGMWAYFEAGFHNLLVVSVENRFQREARKTALGLMGTGQLALTKIIVLVDENVDPRDRSAVFGELARHFDAAEDLILIPGVPLDTLDFTSFTMNLGSKMILDAQSAPGGSERRNPASGAGGESIADRMEAMRGPGGRVLPRGISQPSEFADPRMFFREVGDWRVAWGAMLVVQTAGDGRALVSQLVARPEYAALPLVVAVSPDVLLDDPELLLWGIFTRFDCARDLVPREFEARGAWGSARGPLGIDATWKQGYPEPVENLPEVVKGVDGWWPGLRMGPRR
jgi:4-hydroxy-3-polyprenylbenzoate decarboxylase